MSQPPSARAEALVRILTEVGGLPAEQRDSRLRERCGEDPELRNVVDYLLAAPPRGAGTGADDNHLHAADDDDDDATRDESSPGGAGVGPGSGGRGPPPARPARIGPYKVLQPLGEGGFGSVLMAEQERPIRRTVAIKVIKAGMDTRQVIARFEAERQALAMMDHPNIARVLDAGATEAGRPYFVMELVRGVPITEYCDRQKLPLRDRLDLFVRVCHAVQHAHQKGIIHRDLKPGNVLVAVGDGGPAPKVIDFGIAKATQARLTDKTLFTEHRQLMGTPEYMSPEQAEMTGLDVDTRADIYSLGAVLYELLTGTTPFGEQRLWSRSCAEIQRIVREVEPVRPSARLAAADATGATDWAAGADGADGAGGASVTGATGAAGRAIDPRRLRAELRGELDWIVMKCLEKDRTRRYETAAALAADLTRYLAGRTVLARPATGAYRLGKFLRRHRAAVAAAALVAVVLVAGFAATLFGLISARRSRADADAARGETVAAFQVLRDLTRSDARPGAIPPDVTRALGRLDAGWLKDQPATLAALRSAIGLKYADFDPALAERQFLLALAALPPAANGRPPEAADALLGLGALHMRKGDAQAAAGYFRDAVAAIQAPADDFARDPSPFFAPWIQAEEQLGHPDAARALRLRLHAWEIRALTASIAANQANQLALAHRAQKLAEVGHFDAAAADLKRFAALNPQVLRPRVGLGYVLLYLGDEAGHRQVAADLLARAPFADPGVDELDVARLCLLPPKPAGGPDELRRLIEAAGTPADGPSDVPARKPLVQALAHYRAGNLRMARDALQRQLVPGAPESPDAASCQLLMAMCQHRLGFPRDTARWYHTATQTADRWPKPGSDTIKSFPSYLAYQVLKREADQLLRRTGPDGGPAEDRPGSD